MYEEKQGGFTNTHEAMAFIRSTSWKGSSLGLSRVSLLLLELLGNPQLHNAAAVIETVYALGEQGWKISDEAHERGLRETK